MIRVLTVHRRLAAIYYEAVRRGGFHKLTDKEQRELHQCLRLNADVLRLLDELNQLSELARQVNDVHWQHDICARLDKLEALHAEKRPEGR